jgi:hypothetical protein
MAELITIKAYGYHFHYDVFSDVIKKYKVNYDVFYKDLDNAMLSLKSHNYFLHNNNLGQKWENLGKAHGETFIVGFEHEIVDNKYNGITTMLYPHSLDIKVVKQNIDKKIIPILNKHKISIGVLNKRFYFCSFSFYN